MKFLASLLQPFLVPAVHHKHQSGCISITVRPGLLLSVSSVSTLKPTVGTRTASSLLKVSHRPSDARIMNSGCSLSRSNDMMSGSGMTTLRFFKG
ncbi:hypothetical protein EYF80_009379 [Liparis tanakae]|uniref:Uncharacterized protein n=1 Tax=Liparis tanakae TaxID=230148 RepID=A0A4Z2IR13_9TELE|nr:hypothetical protein EYF80_009379 [Liparis tanakae]